MTTLLAVLVSLWLACGVYYLLLILFLSMVDRDDVGLVATLERDSADESDDMVDFFYDAPLWAFLLCLLVSLALSPFVVLDSLLQNIRGGGR